MTTGIHPGEFRTALSKFATGVTIVTTVSEAGEFVGVTANSFNSASLSPPLVLWSLATAAHSLLAFQQSSYFGVHILAVHQAELALRFAKRGAAKFEGLAVETGPDGIPLLLDFAVRFVCRKVYDYDGGDHRILVGEVVALATHDKESLLFHRGQFSTAVPNAIDGMCGRRVAEIAARKMDSHQRGIPGETQLSLGSESRANRMLTTDALVAHAAAIPSRPAIITGDAVIDWQSLCDRVARLAGAYAAAGIDPGDLVAVLAENSAAYLETTLAVHWLGGIIVPLNLRWTEAELIATLDHCGASTLLADSHQAERARRLRSRLPALRRFFCLRRGNAAADADHDEYIKPGNRIERRLPRGDEAASIFHTGGTTGLAKGVVLSHENHVIHSMLVAAGVSFDHEVRYLHAAPMFHVADALFIHLITLLGGTHHLLPRFDGKGCLEAIQRHRITDTILVPTMIHQMLSVPDLGSYDLSSLRRIFYGASPIAETTLHRLMQAVPRCDLIQLYGQTEASPALTLLRPEDHRPQGSGKRRLRSAGRALLATQVRIVDADDVELPQGSVGEVVARGPQVMAGYWRSPEQTATALRNGWLHTGDAGYLDEDGFLYITDRVKDMIITGGENVYTLEVENVIYALPGVAQCAVIGIPHEAWGEAVHALVVPEPGAILSAADVAAHCALMLANYKRPRSITVSDKSLPLSGAGKILKGELRASFWSGAP